MTRRRVNTSLKEIARESGVSIATVSRVLRGLDQCAAATRERVLAAAGRLRYRPNLLVQGLQTGRTRTIGCIICFRDEFFGRVAAGIHEALAAADYVGVFVWPAPRACPTEPTDELEQIHRLLDRRVDGFILRPNDDGVNDNYLREIWDRGIPLVAVDRDLERTHADFVGTDDEAGGRLAAEHLLGLGHRFLGHLAGPEAITTSRLRRTGFATALAAAAALEPAVEVDETFGGPGTLAAARRLLRRTPQPTAVFLANDYQAPALYQAAAERGLRIPQDLSVVGFADLALCGHLQPNLTTIRQDAEGIGRAAAGLVLARIAGAVAASEALPEKQRLAPVLMPRASSGPAPGASSSRQAARHVAVLSEQDLAHPRTSYHFRQVTHRVREELAARNEPARLYVGRVSPCAPVAAADAPFTTCPELVEAVDRGGVSAVLAVGGVRPGLAAWLRARAVPLVGNERSLDCVVATDQRELVRRGLRCLQAHGRSRIAVMHWGEPDLIVEELAACGLPVYPHWIRCDLPPAAPGAGWDEFREIWSAGRAHWPDGLLVTDDILFADAREAILRAGVRVPEDLLIVTHANRGAPVPAPFPVARVEADPDALARAMVALWEQVWAGRVQPPCRHFLPFELIDPSVATLSAPPDPVPEPVSAASAPLSVPAPRRRALRRFTLIELLVVVAIIGVLAALLLPSLERARMRAKSAICMGQLRQVSMALLMYAADNDTHLPFVNANANPSTSQTHPFGLRSGYGYLVLGRYVENHRILYCPDAIVFDGWGGVQGGTQSRMNYMRTLPQDVANNIDRRVDYNLGWWGGAPTLMQYESGAGFGRATGGRRTLYWACDDFGIFPYYYRIISHGGGHFMNVARIDGGVSRIVDWREKQPTTGNYGYYYPYNDRPGWGWWRYFGTGQGFD